jgi:hypothetical protein
VVQDVISKAAADQQATAARLTKEHQAAVQRLTAQKDADVAAARRELAAAGEQVGGRVPLGGIVCCRVGGWPCGPGRNCVLMPRSMVWTVLTLWFLRPGWICVVWPGRQVASLHAQVWCAVCRCVPNPC